MLEGLMTIPDIVEEVKLILPGEKRRAYAMYWRIAPPLWAHKTLPYFEVPVPSV